ncbi:lymphocyte antigen 6A-2/6E-1-like [Tenrec ecaudatus]|uniref:lymphocyte antigen 6A-2/6E-1-like n=1 Tax=Tenrec ecaudatus TaxID=94439 RepID=UPI003F596872
MKTALVLLGALLCTQRAQGLRCHHCFAVPFLGACCEEVCPFPDGVCVFQEVTASVEAEELRVHNQFCLPVCPENDLPHHEVHLLGARLRTWHTCCQDDLCNGMASRASERGDPCSGAVSGARDGGFCSA